MPLNNQRLLLVVGMSTAWLPVVERLLYPISFSSANKNDPLVYLFNVIYFLAVIAIALGLSIISYRTKRTSLSAKAEGCVVLVTGLGGAFGILVTAMLDISRFLEAVFVGAGMLLVAVYVPVSFVFWSLCLARCPGKYVLVDAALSLALVAFYFVVCGVFDLRVAGLAVTLAIVSAVLGFIYATKYGTTQRKSSKPVALRWASTFRTSLVLLVLCNVAIAFFNNSAKLHDAMPYRWVGYVGDIVVALTIAVLYLPGKKKRRSTMGAFSVVTLTFVAMLLLAALVSQDWLQMGTVPLHCANAVLIMFAWLMIIRSANRQKRNPIGVFSLYLAAVILVTRFFQALLMYGPNYVTMFSQSIDRIVVVVCFATIAVALIIAAANRAYTAKMDDVAEAQANVSAMAGFTTAKPQDLSKEQWEDAQRVIRLENYLKELQKTTGLSEREMDVANLTLKNYSAKKMADTLFVSVNTIYSHLKSIYRKTNVHSREEFIAIFDNDFLGR